VGRLRLLYSRLASLILNLLRIIFYNLGIKLDRSNRNKLYLIIKRTREAVMERKFESLKCCKCGEFPDDAYTYVDGEVVCIACYSGNIAPDDERDMFLTDTEADADALASAGFGTDEDYGYYGGEDF
jgi:hypothetical protein